MRVIPMSGKTCMKVLEKMGYFMNSSKGAHRRYAHPTKLAICVPDHKELQTGMLRAIIKQTGVSVEEFYRVFNSL